MVKLRPYQQDLLRQVQDALDSDAKARVMMQLPTGGGKTIIAGRLAHGRTQGGLADAAQGIGFSDNENKYSDKRELIERELG